MRYFNIATDRARARTGCLFVLAALCLADIGRTQELDGGTTSDATRVNADAFTIDSPYRGRQLKQDAAVFVGGPGSDGGNGGLAGSVVGAGNGAGIAGVGVNPNGGGGGSVAGGATGNAGSGGSGGSGISRPIKIRPIGPISPPRPTCGFGEYILNNQCQKCVSRLPTASTEILRGKTCAKPFGVNSPTSCNFGDLSGVQIGKTEDPLTVSTCIDSTRDVVTIYVPRPGFYFFGVNTVKYLFDSISLAGAPLVPAPGIPSNYNYIQTVNGIEVDALVFTGTSAILQKAKGQRVAINGIINVVGNFDLCFAATAEVCQ